MYIKNKFLRFALSFLFALLLYYLVIFSVDRIDGGSSSFSTLLQWMFLFAAFGFIIVIPLLVLVTYLSFRFLTKREEPDSQNL